MPSSPSPIITSTRPNGKRPIIFFLERDKAYKNLVLMFLKLGWPKVLTFHFLCDTQTQNIKRFFFFPSILPKKKKKNQVHFDTYLCIPSREIKIWHFVFLFYQSGPFLFPQKVNNNKKKTHTLLFVPPKILYLPFSLNIITHQQQRKNTHSSQHVKINQKPKTSATFTRVS